ncbi:MULTISPECIES: DinB family protein [Paenibacillus]|uniref:DinB family protein n=1 Tax=Paenibacillus TaxID=44249 RepID=UPI0022B8E8B5|nr:DinB family protein [Paenibacillus caseinilyticus]MCZ8520914.1 damage-inducible protein DinB [Paenibacillus caseinilyticus]
MTCAATMYQYHIWANRTLLGRLDELPQDVYTQEIRSIFPTVSKAMAHIYTTDCAWLSIMDGKSMNDAIAASASIQADAEQRNATELSSLFGSLSAQYASFFGREPDLEKKLLLDNPYAGIRETSLSEMVLQVVNHGTYHRGNVSAMLRQMGHASTMTEYALFWYAGGSPAEEQGAPAV